MIRWKAPCSGRGASWSRSVAGGCRASFRGARADGAFAQRVAIKVLRAGLDTPEDRERFRIERQILASLDHPYIARLLDGGVAPDGRPYLVLDYIEGVPLTTHCTQQSLDRDARIRLILAVAEAMQSAHRQLVVHRDLKPSNILVGADGRPRLLDFGIAKILEPTSDASAVTSTRRQWLTPQYAAPEQFSGAPITTATDVYQLGVVAYELLSGRRPFDSSDSTSLESQVLHDDPQAPSIHVSSLGGDIDAVLLKALRKEPEQRYASITDFAADLGRVLDGDPVAARTGNRAYRWRRFLRRRALPLSLAASGIAVVLIYLVTLNEQNRRIARALDVATTERAKAEQVTVFLLGLFQVNDPQPGRRDTVSARTLMARGEQHAMSLRGQPEVQAEMLDLIGRVRLDLGAYADARPNLEQGLAIRRRVLSDSHPDVALSLSHLARLDELDARLPAAEDGYRQALARQRARLGDAAPATLTTLFSLAQLVHSAGRVREADSLFVEWQRLIASSPILRDSVYADQLVQLAELAEAGIRTDSTNAARAEQLFRKSIAVRREVFGARHITIATSMGRVANLMWQRGALAEAETLNREAISMMRSLFPNGHVDLAVPLFSLASRLNARGRHAEAVPLYAEAADVARRFLTPDNAMLGVYVSNYGTALLKAGDAAAAEPVVREALEYLARSTGPTNLLRVRVRMTLSDVLRARHRWAEAESELLGAYRVLASTRGVSDSQTQRALNSLISLYDERGRRADAARYRALVSSTTSAATKVPGSGAGRTPPP